jgi:hypothetical protein
MQKRVQQRHDFITSGMDGFERGGIMQGTMHRKGAFEKKNMRVKACSSYTSFKN